jgi:hypothetical protein
LGNPQFGTMNAESNLPRNIQCGLKLTYLNCARSRSGTPLQKRVGGIPSPVPVTQGAFRTSYQ